MHLILETIQKLINVVIYAIGILAVNEGRSELNIMEESFATSLEIRAMQIKLSRI